MKQPFDELEQLRFSPTQKETLIRRLTAQKTGERLRLPYRGLVALVAAASLLIGAAGAVSLAGVSPEFREMFGITTQAEEDALGAVSIQRTFPDQNGTGAAITVREVVRDQERLFVLADFTAPEGTVLPEPEHPYSFADQGYWLDGSDKIGEKALSWNLFQNEACTQQVKWKGLGFHCEALKDEDPTDNVIPLLLYLDVEQGFPAESNYFRLQNIFYLYTYRNGEAVPVVENMDIEMVIPISTPSPTYRFSGRCGVKLNSSTMAVVENLALSPLSISMDLILADGETYDKLLKEQGGINAYLLLKDGTRTPLQFHETYGILDRFYTETGDQFFRSDHVYFTPESPIDLSQIKDIIFVGDNDPEKMGQNVTFHFQFSRTRFFNEAYWSEVNTH